MNIVTIRHFSLYRDEETGNMDRSLASSQYRHESLESLRRQHIRYRNNELFGYFTHGVLFSNGEVYRTHGMPDPDDYETDEYSYEEDWGDDE